jgi:hypothetical protein
MESLPPSQPDLLTDDRVQLISEFDDVPIGTFGTVMASFEGSLFYDVQFDGHAVVRVVEGSKLALVQRERTHNE